jgi:uncharacterized protein YndB with AHSA1/START domain
MTRTHPHTHAINLLVIAAILNLTCDALARTLTWETTVDAPVADVWAAFTTEEGIESWMVPHATVDLRVGGEIRTSYVAEPTPDHPSTIVHRILSYEPMRMLSTRVECSPDDFEHAWVIEHVWGVTRFTSVGPNRTHVHMASMGWGEGERWDAAERFFLDGNAWTLAQLETKFADDLDDARSTSDGTLDLLHRLIGGEWIHESTQPDGSVFRVRSVVERGPDERSLIAKGWLGGAAGMYYHGTTQVWREPETGRIRFQNINENGAIARGTIETVADDEIRWNWTATELDGRSVEYDVRMRFIDRKQYRFILSMPDDQEGMQELVNIVYDRVDEAPERFRVMTRE